MGSHHSSYALLGLSLRLLVVTALTLVLFWDSVGGKRGFDGCWNISAVEIGQFLKVQQEYLRAFSLA